MTVFSLLHLFAGRRWRTSAEIGAKKGLPLAPAPSQRAQAIKRRRQIWEALHPTTGQRFESVWEALHPEEIQVEQVDPPEFSTGYKQPPPQEKAFAASTAAVTGESKVSINRHLARADALGDDLEPCQRPAGRLARARISLEVEKVFPPQDGPPCAGAHQTL